MKHSSARKNPSEVKTFLAFGVLLETVFCPFLKFKSSEKHMNLCRFNRVGNSVGNMLLPIKLITNIFNG